MEWIAVKKRKPTAVFNDDRNGEPYLSEDVAVYFGGNAGDGSFEIANYDHDAKHWSLPNSSFNQPDIDPTHWCPLPEKPAE